MNTCHLIMEHARKFRIEHSREPRVVYLGITELFALKKESQQYIELRPGSVHRYDLFLSGIRVIEVNEISHIGLGFEVTK